MNSFQFYSPTKVVFGKEKEKETGLQIREFGGSRVLIVYGGGSVKKNGVLDKVEASLKEAGLEYVLFGGAQPNPVVSHVREGIALARKEKIDFVLAVGGGSAIDTAKTICMGVYYDGDVWDIFENIYKPEKALPNGCVLTIAAAGSECSDGVVITNEDGMLKKGYGNNMLRCRFAIMNPEFLYTLPKYQIACGVVDIIMHTMERYFSIGGVNEMTDLIAEALMKNTIHYGAIAVQDPHNYEAMSEVMWAGSLSHNDLTGLGRAGNWTTHNLEHELSGLFGVAHGAGLAALFNAFARYACAIDNSRFVRFATNVWNIPLDEADPDKTAQQGIRKITEFFHSIGMPVTTTELLGRQLTDAEIDEMAVKATYFGKRTCGRYMKLGAKEMAEIYHMSI